MIKKLNAFIRRRRDHVARADDVVRSHLFDIHGSDDVTCPVALYLLSICKGQQGRELIYM